MILLPEKWLYVSTMKCATNSLYKALPIAVPDCIHVPTREFHPIPVTRWAPTHWTVVRNPYDRAVSIWHSTCCRKANQNRYKAFQHIIDQGADPFSFDAFVEHILIAQPVLPVMWLFRNQSDWVDQFILDRHLLFENLENGLEYHFGIKTKLPYENVSKGRQGWPHYYPSASTKEKVVEWAGDDFVRFGYDK